MSNRVLKSNLSTEGINALIAQLTEYSNNLEIIADKIVRRLAEMGIEVAQSVVYADWRQCIEFKYIPMKMGAGNLTAWDIEPIHRVWYTSDNKQIRKQKEADVSPLLMSEFGAGWYALEGHRGTFPGQHNAYKSVWYWYDEAGNRYSSEDDYHMVATQPMYRAFAEMMVIAERVVKEVFLEYGLSR